MIFLTPYLATYSSQNNSIPSIFLRILLVCLLSFILFYLPFYFLFLSVTDYTFILLLFTGAYVLVYLNYEVLNKGLLGLNFSRVKTTLWYFPISWLIFVAFSFSYVIIFV